MKLERLRDLLDIYKFAIGAVSYCVDGIRSRLEELGDAEALELADRAREKVDRASSLQFDWEQKKRHRPLKRDGAAELDKRVDQAVTNLIDAVDVYTGLPEDSEIGKLARELKEELFPSGAFPITSMAYEDQYGRVDIVLESLRGPYVEHVSVLRLQPFIERLDELNEQFGESLSPERDGVTYDEIESARNEAEDAFHRLLICVLHHYADDFETLNFVLRPVLVQTERTRRHLKRRGTIPEVDPETGEPVEADDEQSDETNQPVEAEG